MKEKIEALVNEWIKEKIELRDKAKKRIDEDEYEAGYYASQRANHLAAKRRQLQEIAGLTPKPHDGPIPLITR